MASNSTNQFTPQQYIRYNGQSVSKSLNAIGNEASADELANFISQDIGQKAEEILHEVKKVLRRGVANGFLERNGEYYSFIGNAPEVHVDSDKRRGNHSSNRKIKTPRRIELVRKNYVEEEVEEESIYEEEDSEPEEFQEMQADSVENFRPKVKLYEIYHPPESGSDDDEQNLEEEPPQKRTRLQLAPQI